MGESRRNESLILVIEMAGVHWPARRWSKGREGGRRRRRIRKEGRRKKKDSSFFVCVSVLFWPRAKEKQKSEPAIPFHPSGRNKKQDGERGEGGREEECCV